MNGVLVILETVGDDLAAISRELLGKGRQLADALGGSLAALAIGPTTAVAARAAHFGAAQIFTVEAPALSQYTTVCGSSDGGCQDVQPGSDHGRYELPDARFWGGTGNRSQCRAGG